MVVIAICPECGHRFDPKSGEADPMSNPKSAVLERDPKNPKSGDGFEVLEAQSSNPAPKAKSPRGKNKNYSPKFEAWYAVYPRHEEKLAAAKAFDKALLLVDMETLTNAAIRYAGDPNRDDTFTKLPSTWLNKGCWEDEALPSRNGQGLAAKLRRQAGAK